MSRNYELKKTQVLVRIALFVSVVASLTTFTAVSISGGGYFNLGDVAVMLLATMLPFRQALIAASLGSMLADLFVGAAHYALFTGFIKGMMVFVVFSLRPIFKGRLSGLRFVSGSLVMLLGYALVDVFILGTLAFLPSLLSNALQAALGCTIAAVCYPFTKKLMEFLEER